MELSIIEILLGMGIGMMILFFGLWSGGSVGRVRWNDSGGQRDIFGI